jgi:hypothetical protein
VPIRFDHDSGRDVLIATVSGTLSIDDGQAGAAAMWTTVAGDAPAAVVWDMRDARLDFAAGDVQSLAQYILSRQPTPPPKRVALVAGRDVDFGLMRMFEVYREHQRTETRVFRDYDAAIEWAARARAS